MKWIAITTALFFLAGCNPGFVSEITAKPGEILFIDNFSSISGVWQPSESEVGSTGYYDGFFRIEIDVVEYDLWATSGRQFRNVFLEVDAARIDGPVENRYGLVCRVTPAGEHYFFIISSDGYAAIGVASYDSNILLGQTMMIQSDAIRTGILPNHLGFSCNGLTLQGYVNGVLVIDTTDGMIRSGDVGLIAGAFQTTGVEIVFDNFCVTKP